MRLSASYLYSGMSDYFGGHGCDDNEALLYAYYDHRTTLRGIIDQLVDDSWTGPACEDLPEDFSDKDVHEALLGMLSSAGRADYDSGARAECAVEYGEVNDLGEDDEDDDWGESPIFIVLLTWEKDTD